MFPPRVPLDTQAPVGEPQGDCSQYGGLKLGLFGTMPLLIYTPLYKCASEFWVRILVSISTYVEVYQFKSGVTMTGRNCHLQWPTRTVCPRCGVLKWLDRHIAEIGEAAGQTSHCLFPSLSSICLAPAYLTLVAIASVGPVRGDRVSPDTSP